MDNKKWLKRKYPNDYNEIVKFFDDNKLEQFKKLRCKIGRLTEQIERGETYPIGTLIMFKKSNPVYDEDYPMHIGTVKCINKNITESGYHSFFVMPNQYKEIEPQK